MRLLNWTQRREPVGPETETPLGREHFYRRMLTDRDFRRTEFAAGREVAREHRAAVAAERAQRPRRRTRSRAAR
jgi:hypothetical protein